MTKTSPVTRFWNLLKVYRAELRQIYVYAFFIGVVNLTLPVGIQAIINYIQTGELTTSWVILVSFVLIGIALNGFLQIIQLRIVENVQQSIFARSSFEFSYRMPRITSEQLDRQHAPELMNRFFDTFTIQKGLPKILIDFSLSSFQIVFGLILLSIYSQYFVLLGILMIVFIWLIFKTLGPKGMETSILESKYKFNLAHWLEEIARVTKTVKTSSCDSDFHLKKTDEITSSYLTAREKHFQLLIKQFTSFVFFKVFIAGSLLILGGVLVFAEELDIGQFVAAEIIIILIINSVEKAVGSIETIYDVLTGLDKVGHVTDFDLDNNTGISKLNREDSVSIKVDRLDYNFPNERKKIIRDISFSIENNAKVLLDGQSGSGKSVLIKLIAGILEPTDGDVLINNVSINNYNKNSLYKSLSILLPENQIFEGSIKENITLGGTYSDNQINEMISALNLKEFITKEPLGVDGWVDSGGRRLPRSVIQKIMIARALISKPKILLVEDPLQFITEEDKKQIIDYIMSDERDCTVLLTSYYQYWKDKCDQKIEL